MGRPPKAPRERLVDVGIRLPRSVIEAADREVAEGLDRSAVIRRWIAAGMALLSVEIEIEAGGRIAGVSVEPASK